MQRKDPGPPGALPDYIPYGLHDSHTDYQGIAADQAFNEFVNSSGTAGYGNDLLRAARSGDPNAVAAYARKYGTEIYNSSNTQGTSYYFDSSGNLTYALSNYDGSTTYEQSQFNNATNKEDIYNHLNSSEGLYLLSLNNLANNSKSTLNAGFADDTGQLLNLGQIVWGASELGLQTLRHANNGPQQVARFLGFGTQRTAAALRGTVETLHDLGGKLGAAGQLLNTGVYLYKLADPNSTLTTGDHAGFWAGTGIYAASILFSNPITAGVALGYGVLELGSWIYNGKTVEQNLFDK